MRMAVIAHKNTVVIGTLDGVERARQHAADRQTNGEALDGETPVRLPRRLSRIRRYENYSAWINRLRAWCHGL